MIVDVHTHIFPPRMTQRRGRLVARDPSFAELYGEASARMATAEMLLESMDAAGVDLSIVCGFWWSDAELAEEHAVYLLDVAADSGGRLLPFVPVGGGEAGRAALERALRGGARGLGEVRPGHSASDVDELLGVASRQGLTALVHASEEVGHAYPGKAGGYAPGAIWRLLQRVPSLRVIAAHWGAGLPFFALMPEMRALLDSGRLAFDSAASPLLYEPAVFAHTIELCGVEHVLWGSDFPLRDQAADRAAVEAAIADEAQRAAVLGGNAARFLALPGNG